MPSAKLVDLDARLVETPKMPESRGTNPTGNICVRRDCHRAPSPADALLEATRKARRGRCDGEGAVQARKATKAASFLLVRSMGPSGPLSSKRPSTES
jgi:hypothetical protein